LTAVFLAGPLRDDPLRATVLGGEHLAAPAVLLSAQGTQEGVALSGLSAHQIQRIAFYAAAASLNMAEGQVRLAEGEERTILAVTPADGIAMSRDFSAWQARWATTARATAQEAMAQYGVTPPELLRRRWGQMLTRGGAMARAAEPRPDTHSLRRLSGPADVVSQARRWPYSHYFAVEEHDLQFRRFDGGMSPPLDRAVFISGDAAVVLPYDPVRDRVLLIEQFRVGPYARGDVSPWLLEAVAGRIDGGETPQEAARREAEEEAGLKLRDLIAGPRYYPSPAAKAEYIYSFVGIADLPDGTEGIGGLATEAEDIRSHLIGFEALMRLIGSGEIDNAPLMLIALWLERLRPDLRSQAQPELQGET
jgi:nudix-type nucleoside diphosphatase (YffH/AdpP family)